MSRLVLATHNRDKFREIREALGGAGFELVPAYDFPGVPEVVEDGKTLEENSLKKARELSAFTGFPAMADDTGLFVDALEGRPGIYAARYAGEGCTYEDNVRKLLGEMAGVPEGKRRAVFRTAISLFFPGENPAILLGEVEGVITAAARGSVGFGYDPVFQPSGFSKVFAEMTVEEKNKVSHRGRAVAKAREWLMRLAK